MAAANECMFSQLTQYRTPSQVQPVWSAQRSARVLAYHVASLERENSSQATDGDDNRYAESQDVRCRQKCRYGKENGGRSTFHLA